MQTVVVVDPATAPPQAAQHLVELVFPSPFQRHGVRHDLNTTDAAVLLHVEVALVGVDRLYGFDHVVAVVVPDLQLHTHHGVRRIALRPIIGPIPAVVNISQPIIRATVSAVVIVIVEVLGVPAIFTEVFAAVIAVVRVTLMGRFVAFVAEVDVACPAVVAEVLVAVIAADGVILMRVPTALVADGDVIEPAIFAEKLAAIVAGIVLLCFFALVTECFFAIVVVHG